MTVAGDTSTSPTPPVRLVGLTGGIATGKSTVARMLVDRGAALVDSDRLARAVVAPGQPALAEIAATLGGDLVDADGGLDRAATAALVFGDPQARARLEAITHPRIQELTAQRVTEALATAAPLVVVDIPLLYERGREDVVEGVLVVWCDALTQRRRLRARDGLDESEADVRLAAQLPIDEKRRRATWVIDNTGALASTGAQVEAWWHTWVRS